MKVRSATGVGVHRERPGQPGSGGGAAGVWRGPARQGGGTLRRAPTPRVWFSGAAIAPGRQRFGRAAAVIFLLLSLRSEGYFPP